jgi:hypothetical protein
LTYMAAAFLSEEPLLRYDGVGPEDVLGSILMEMAIAQQCRRAKVPLDLHTMWRDGFSYGFSAGYIGYENRTAYRTMTTPETEYSDTLGKAIPTGRSNRIREKRNIFSGGTLTAIDPYMCLPDPNIPIHNVQKGEFFGWIDRVNLMTLLESERDNPDDYFNCRYLKHTTTTSIMNTRTSTAREDRVGGSTDSAVSNTTPVYVCI